jgi:gliding motility-associated-like protein
MNYPSKHNFSKHIVLLLVLCFNYVVGLSQLSVTQQTASTLVQNVLLGSGVTVSNIQFTGAGLQIGRFNGANSNIGLPSGIIMSTGNIGDAVGPNNSPSIGDDLNRPGYGPLSNIIAGEETEDAAILSFNFVCESNKVSFRYVFASEEYPEYVGSQFNDIFAFFIQGPGIVGTQNIAKIPGTNQFVAINNVNQSSFNNFFVNNGNGSVGGGGSSVQFDGFTRPFVAEATVIPCETYTITIAIADVSDGIFDSSVFLEAQSFTSPEVTIEQKISYVNGLDSIYEDCGFNTITLKRTGETSQPLTINLQTQGTATIGVDYSSFPTTVTFGSGQSEISFNVFALTDNINESAGESVSIIYADTGCSEIVLKRVDFTIFDPPPILSLNPGFGSELICPRQPIQLEAFVTGGVAPYTIQWIGQSSGNPVTVYPDSTDWYLVSATDQCGTIKTDSVFVEIVNYFPLKLSVTSDTVICKGETASIGGIATGGRQPLIYSWTDEQIFTPYRSVTPTESKTYVLSVTDSCGIVVKKEIRVKVIDAHAVFDVKYLDHSTIQFIDLSYTNIASWNWDFGTGAGESELQNPIYTFPDTGQYTITLIVSDEDKCTDTISNTIISYPPFSFYIPNAFTPDGDGINDEFSGVGEGFVNYELVIFNRWGEEIFSSANYQNKWGIGARGVLDNIPIDVYAYRIIVTTPILERKEYIGRVTVIR